MLNTKALSAKDWYDRGNDSKRSGDHTAALAYFKQSIKLNPQSAAPWIGIAKLLDANSQFEEARQCFMHAVVADPKYLMARQMLAVSHQKLGYVDESEREYKQAIKLKPDSDMSYLGLGQLFEDLGKPEKAADAYRKSSQYAPEKQDALANLLGLSKHIDVSKEIEQAKIILNTLGDREKALVGYGLGKAHQQQQDYEAAFTTFDVANKARKNAYGVFNRETFDNRVETMIKLFSSEFFKTRKSWGNHSERPVFIVGLPRSGTTLTEQILASHPHCFGAGELNVLTDLATGTPDRLGNNDITWPKTAEHLSHQQVLQLAQDYLADSGKRAPEAIDKVVDKQPLNFWHLGLVAMALPNARIVHCTRDIRDCGLSIFTQNFNETQSWSTDLDDIAYYWQGYEKLMAHFKQVSGLQILDVNYEETVSNIEQQSKTLLDFVGLTWDEQVLNFHQSDRAVQTPSRWQVRQPLYQTSKARWRNYEKYLGPLIKAVQEK